MPLSSLAIVRRKASRERFISLIAVGPGCWMWRGQVGKRGYGVYGGGSHGRGERVLAHRRSWEIFNDRRIPKGKLVLHSCDVRLCVNPQHLRLGTDKENAKDRIERGRDGHLKRSTCPYGHPYDGTAPRGERLCLTCHRATNLRATHKRRGKAVLPPNSCDNNSQ